MTIARAIGLFLILAGFAALGADLLAAGGMAAFRLRTAGELWYGLHPASLELSQVFIERYVWPPIWNPGIVTLLLWPAAPLFAATGFVLLGVTRWMQSRSR